MHQDQNFELIVLEAALDHVVRKFGRHLQIIKPSVEMILQQIEANPETNGLKRLLAVKKSFAEFEQKVEHYAKILRNILADDEDMIRIAFRVLDKYGTGTISSKNFKHLMTHIGEIAVDKQD